MKLLLDENLPQATNALAGHDCFTTTFMQWSGIENGDLLRRAAGEHFDALITTDKGIEYQQNQANLPVAVVVLIGKDNKLKTIESLLPALIVELARLKPKGFVKVEMTE